MKTKKFTSQEAYEAWADTAPEGYEMIPAVVDNGWKINADIEVECKSWKTAFRRFAKAFAGIPEIEEWLPGIQECCESGMFQHTSTWGMTPEEAREDTKYGSYAWGVESFSTRTPPGTRSSLRSRNSFTPSRRGRSWAGA